MFIASVLKGLYLDTTLDLSQKAEKQQVLHLKTGKNCIYIISKQMGSEN